MPELTAPVARPKETAAAEEAPQTGERRDAARSTLVFLERLLAGYHPRDFAVRLWDGTCWPPETGAAPRFTLVLRHPGALRSMLLRWGGPSLLSVGEAYIYDDLDIEGDVHAVFPVAEHVLAHSWTTAEQLKLATQLLRLPAPPHDRQGRQAARLGGVLHSRGRDRAAVTYHYDTSNDFYALYLDEQMVYSCAYFASLDDDLDSAQRRKLDYVCRKLRLRPGMRLLDIGCGWGALVRHAARAYGVQARGITLSRPQAELARERIHAEGLDERCTVEVADYRELAEPDRYDALVSVGMAEHVGESRIGEYFARAWRVLRPGGVFLNHAIAPNPMHREARGESFVDRYVFPDGELLPISTLLSAAETNGFEVRDVESLREHYALTLRHWVRRLEANHAAAVAATDETTFRVWRIYMAGSAHAFESGRLNVYQTLLVKQDHGKSYMPLSRADWYAS
jgi:cyclopropane-fatty-acyl-phospholipid synthase